MVKDGGGGELNNARKVLIFQIVAGVQAATGQDGILDAGGQEVFIAHFQIEIVQFLQQTALRVIPQVLQIVPIDPAHGTAGLFHELPANVSFLARAVLPLQRRRDSAGLFRRHFPQIGHFCAPDRAGVRYVKDIFQMRPSARAGTNESDTLGPGLYPPPHGIVP